MSIINDKTHKQNLLKKLVNLDLTEKEALVYVDLLRRKHMVGTSKIILSTKLHGQYVYSALATLAEKGLVKHVVLRGRKKFSATSPTRLSAMMDAKRKVADDVTQELLAYVGQEHEQDFEIFQGDLAFISREFDVLNKAESEEEWLIIGGTGDKFIQTFGKNSFAEYESIRERKRIAIRYIGSENQHAELLSIKKYRKNFDFRVLPKFKESIVNTVVRRGNITLTTFGNPLLSYELKNSQVVESYANFFESLWLL